MLTPSTGSLLQRQYKEATVQSRVHGAVLADFRESVGEETVQAWEKDVIAWESDPINTPDPYCTDSTGARIPISNTAGRLLIQRS
jgi:hypothetical protein